MTTHTNRRDFLRVSALAGGGLILGWHSAGAQRFTRALSAAQGSADPFAPNAWIRLMPDGVLTVIVDRSEMGQGVDTTLPMLIAEEMDADWSTIRVEHAPADPAYNNGSFGIQATGGSTSIRSSWKHFREAGAAARQMLVGAAAQQWGVDASSCSTSNGVVSHAASGRSVKYGDLAVAAAAVAVPKEPKLKDPKDYKILGTRVKRIDTPAKVNGTAQFGMDVTLPGMLVAVVKRPPVFGATLDSRDASKAMAIRGVRKVVPITNGVAVVADGYWAAKKGCDALSVTWHEGTLTQNSSARISQQMRDAANRAGGVARNDGNATDALAKSAKRIEAEYEVPFLAHATMEPMNCVADVRADGCDVYAPTQRQDDHAHVFATLGSRDVAAQITGLPVEKVRIHTTYLGGGFGRKFETDFVQDAVELSKAVGKPVKVIFTREDDIQHDFYRTASYTKFAAGLDAEGWPVAWTSTVVSASTFMRHFPALVKDGVDSDCVDGAANIPYDIANQHVKFVMQEFGVPIGFWRGVGISQNAFMTECFIDELAAATKKDPVEFRRKLLAKQPRHLAVLNLAAEKSGWGSPLPAGRYRGIAVQEMNDTVVAEVAEISLDAGNVRVHRVVAAVDCGRVLNPDTVEAQVEGAIVFGLTAALYGEITIERGRVKQGNFNDYQMLKLREMPAVETYVVPSTADPTGIGEPPVPPIAPAVANAVRAATGVPVRKLPIRLASVTQTGKPGDSEGNDAN